MTTLKERLRADFTTHWKARDELETTTLRNVLGAIQTQEKGGKIERVFDDDEIEALIGREVKKRFDTAEEYQRAGALDRAARERAEAKVLEPYLPQQLDEQELTGIVDRVLATFNNPTPREFGQIMKAVLAETGSRADGKTVSAIVRQRVQ